MKSMVVDVVVVVGVVVVVVVGRGCRLFGLVSKGTSPFRSKLV